MSQQSKTTRVRAIAFHLPQFHPIPENDRWWGKGFTEWTNTAKAKPLFRGHYQPHVPADLGFYDLRLPEARAAQAELAREHGLEGFCYYHYWFAGRRLLERPVNAILDSGEPDFPFCLCWANHSWNSIWQGSPDKILMEQTYPGPADYEAHFNWLLRAFTDPRYIRVDDKPLFLVYNARGLPDGRAFTDQFRELALRAGLPGLFLVAVSYHHLGWNAQELGFDASTWQPLPARDGHIPWRHPLLRAKMWARRGRQTLTVRDYADVMDELVRKSKPLFLDFPTVLPNWDNTPRSGYNGLVLHGSTPELFGQVLERAVRFVEDYPPQQRLVFIKAWNEWAEGNYLEPDLKFGRGYLEALRKVLG